MGEPGGILSIRTEFRGGLRCRLLGGPSDDGNSPDLVVVLCHGYGAPGDDLVPLAAEIIEDDPVLGALVRFVLPAAPLRLGGFGPYESLAWWALDQTAIEEALALGRPLDQRHVTPEGLSTARERLTALLDDTCRKDRIPLSRLVLGGFSQGAMLSVEAALRLPETIGGLVLFSGALLSQEEWARLAPARRGLPALMTHGRQDPLLSFAAAEALRDLLSAAGVAVQWLPFDGPHTIPAAAQDRLAGLLRTLLRTGDSWG